MFNVSRSRESHHYRRKKQWIYYEVMELWVISICFHFSVTVDILLHHLDQKCINFFIGCRVVVYGCKFTLYYFFLLTSKILEDVAVLEIGMLTYSVLLDVLHLSSPQAVLTLFFLPGLPSTTKLNSIHSSRPSLNAPFPELS